MYRASQGTPAAGTGEHNAAKRHGERDVEYTVTTESGRRTQRIGDPEELRQVLVDDLGVLVTDAESRRLHEGLGT